MRLAGNYVEWEQEDAAAEVHRRLLAHVPDDLDAIVFLFHYHRKRDEALAARDYALQARRLKPASEEMLNMVVAGHFLAARALALQGRWDEARAELAAAAAAGPAVRRFRLRPDGPPGDGRIQGRPAGSRPALGGSGPDGKRRSGRRLHGPFDRGRPL